MEFAAPLWLRPAVGEDGLEKLCHPELLCGCAPTLALPALALFAVRPGWLLLAVGGRGAPNPCHPEFVLPCRTFDSTEPRPFTGFAPRFTVDGLLIAPRESDIVPTRPLLTDGRFIPLATLVRALLMPRREFAPASRAPITGCPLRWIALVNRACSWLNDGRVPADGRAFEKKWVGCVACANVERAAGRPLTLRLCRFGTTGRLPAARRPLANCCRVTGTGRMRPLPN